MSDYLKRIKDIRLAKGLNQSEFANMIGMNQSNYGKIERGEYQLSVNKLLEIAEKLEVPAFSILYDEDDKWVFDKESERTIEQLKNENKILLKEFDQLIKLANISDQNVEILEKYVQSLLNTIDVNQKTIEQLQQIISNDGILNERIVAHTEQLRQFCIQALEETEKTGFEIVKKTSPELTEEEFKEAIATQRKILGLDINYKDYSDKFNKLTASTQKMRGSIEDLKKKIAEEMEKPKKKE